MNAFWEIVVSNAILVVVLAAAVAIVGRFWKNPHGLYVLWLLVLLKFVTPPLFTVGFHLPGKSMSVVHDDPITISAGKETRTAPLSLLPANRRLPLIRASMSRRFQGREKSPGLSSWLGYGPSDLEELQSGRHFVSFGSGDCFVPLNRLLPMFSAWLPRRASSLGYAGLQRFGCCRCECLQ